MWDSAFRAMLPWLLVGLGGAMGSMLRYTTGRYLAGYPWAKEFPVGTFLVNIVGSFVLGVLMVLCIERSDPPRREWQLLLGTGFCGGLTTFSTFQWELFERVREGRIGLAFLYFASSLLAGFVAVVLAVRWLDR
ncbi:fluoride efflux transporter CrcB [Tuwongella immobilis]|uniref:Fluoride-specific ion channel FluC n=1 Tax=Tuwongella immobilis TaxID=692036 RepID=A0A6C2YMX2_9BACT|nr:fluoride efflux transporter CrcB [Tuwongella immobilis]VIP02631.1 chromosome condensation protein : Putative fluoride ion transporter CrcB OS=Meiothermus ruber (strain ATCC 35948 / DSM 1279 / VKM B-1258 / 21) GN=crcB PE=3 SV=1: CRCB [Tuwongella immobilis]VTS01981.1 chromosome condensation protein : Putative fluoride ion transporter CrcB OS=Meiothermus ruber (strain ATCC 35948 / DSM 1279 / VKM B-1258 / 21) GN=crcB PE=3 SV=1: CRCB [Tuwongella immobilis]